MARQRFRLITHTLPGKLRQIGYALWLERHFSKDELLEAYLNIAPYGANIEGVGAAAWVYFHKPVAELSPDEARALVLIPQDPRSRAPVSPAGKRALQAAWRVAYGADPGFERLGFRRREDLPLRAPHFAERVCGRGGEGLASTLDPTVQALAEELLNSFVRQHQAQGIRNAAAMVVRAPRMEVLAYVGSAGYLDRRIQGFVNGLKARRSPGSTLKPFVYALAIGQGLITPDTLLKDTVLRTGGYQPETFEGNYLGPLSATAALVRSRNIPAVALAAQLRRPTLYQFLRLAGLRPAKEEAFYGLTLALGGAEASMEELIGLYGLLANGGDYRALRWLHTDDGGGPRGAPQLLLPPAAFLVRRLKAVEICPVSGALRSPWCPHGKTGWIIPGVSPIATCTVHRQVFINPSNGLRRCRGEEGGSEAQVAEFWDSDVLELFRLAGVRRAAPPPFERPCGDLAGADAGAHPPTIVSPLVGMSYPLRADGNSRIEFSGVSDGGRHRLFWFVDDSFVGEGNTVFWPGRPGRFVVRVVDEQGQSAATVLTAIPVD